LRAFPSLDRAIFVPVRAFYHRRLSTFRRNQGEYQLVFHAFRDFRGPKQELDDENSVEGKFLAKSRSTTFYDCVLEHIPCFGGMAV